MAVKIRYDSVPFNEQTAAKISEITELKSNILFVTNPEFVKEWHPTFNEVLMPDMMTASSGKKNWW